jgi:hypothetical protein
MRLKNAPNLAGWTNHHVPGQIGDFAGARTCFDRKQNSDSVAFGISGQGSKREEAFDLFVG